jgi:hypothetical protein
MAEVREVIEALEREIRFFEEQAEIAATLRDQLPRVEEKNRQEEARIDLELLAHLLRRSLARRKSDISPEEAAR